jgi:hypothetical protein
MQYFTIWLWRFREFFGVVQFGVARFLPAPYGLFYTPGIGECLVGFIAGIGRGFIKLIIFVADVCLLRRAETPTGTASIII